MIRATSSDVPLDWARPLLRLGDDVTVTLRDAPPDEDVERPLLLELRPDDLPESPLDEDRDLRVG